jgi:hypothetical protein
MKMIMMLAITIPKLHIRSTNNCHVTIGFILLCFVKKGDMVDGGGVMAFALSNI